MFLGLDIGTQSLKALIVDAQLRPLGQGGAPLTFAARPGGQVEQAPEDWLSALKSAIAEALKAAALPPEAIKALGIGGQLDGCVPVDGTGEALHPALIWMDRRAQAEAEAVPAATILAQGGLVRDAAHMGAKIAWLRQHRPDLTPHTACYHQPVSFVVAALTRRAVMDRALASTSMLYDLAAQDFSPSLCGAFHIDRGLLPALADMAERAGPLSAAGAALTGLPAGLPVAVGTGDDFTNAIGAGVLRPGTLLCQIGTAEVVGALHPTPVIDEGALVETHAFGAGLFFIENPGWFSGGAVEWLIRLLRLEGVEELNRLAAATPPGAEGVLFLPALTGAMAPEWRADLRGAFQGLAPEHGAGHLARALLEGTAFAMRDVQLRLSAMGLGFDKIALAGGGAASALWAQIRADISGLPVEVSAVKDASPLGAAILAMRAQGALPDLAAAAALLPPPATRYTPRPETHAFYARRHAAYRALFDALKAPLLTAKE